MAQVSSDVLWQNLRRDNAFITSKQLGVTWSTDPYNLLNMGTKKHSGIAHNTGLGLERRGKKKLMVRIKKLRKYAKIGNTGHDASIQLKGSVAGKGHKVVGKKCEDLRPDLVSTAMRRARALHESEISIKEEMNKLVNQSVTVITIEGKHYTGILRSIDHAHNIVLADSVEHVWSSDKPRQTFDQGLVTIRGDDV